MFRMLLFVLLILPATRLTGQSWDPEYFPAPLMAREGVKMAIEYETQIDDPLEQAGQGNRIRLARTMNFEMYFDEQGQRSRRHNYHGTNVIRDSLVFVYDEQGRLQASTYCYLQAANINPESISVNLHQRQTLHFFLPGGKQDYRLVKDGAAPDPLLTDSLQFYYDVLGRLDHQVQYVWRKGKPDSLRRDFSHFARGINITSKSGEATLNRELLKFDGESRLISREYFNAREQAPRYREMYTYNPRGWLEKVNFIYDWNHYQQSESVISRENVYDDHGKLTEAILDYGDGRRVLKFYDYTYFLEE